MKGTKKYSETPPRVGLLFTMFPNQDSEPGDLPPGSWLDRKPPRGGGVLSINQYKKYTRISQGEAEYGHSGFTPPNKQTNKLLLPTVNCQEICKFPYQKLVINFMGK